ncbi:MAG: hypothetical protein WCK98_08140 [bacterium]
MNTTQWYSKISPSKELIYNLGVNFDISQITYPGLSIGKKLSGGGTKDVYECLIGGENYILAIPYFKKTQIKF